MVLEFDDGLIDIVIMTMPKILGFADKRDMRRINRITELVKADKRKGLL